MRRNKKNIKNECLKNNLYVKNNFFNVCKKSLLSSSSDCLTSTSLFPPEAQSSTGTGLIHILINDIVHHFFCWLINQKSSYHRYQTAFSDKNMGCNSGTINLSLLSFYNK